MNFMTLLKYVVMLVYRRVSFFLDLCLMMMMMMMMMMTGWWFGTMEIYDFPYGNFIIPTGEVIFFREVETTKQVFFPVGELLYDFARNDTCHGQKLE